MHYDWALERQMISNPITTVGEKVYQNAGNSAVLSEIPQCSSRILDLGCGAGDNARILFLAGKSVDGVTLSEAEALLAKPYCANVVVGDLEKGLPEGLAKNYDTVIASHVLEHVCYPQKVLADLRSVLLPSGLLIVALPNILFWRYRLRLIFGDFEYEPSGIMDNTHFRWYSYGSAQRFLMKNGFEVLKARAEGSFPLPLVRRFLPQSFTQAIDTLAVNLLPGLFGYQLVFTASIR